MKEVKDYPPYLDRPKKIAPTQKEEELNLCELLKCCEGEEFYCPFYGNVLFKKINGNNVIMCNTDNREVNANFWSSGVAYCTKGSVSLFPSKELYEKYPLDAYSAWMEWAESRKPKRWRAEKDEYYWSLTSRFKVVKCIDYYWEGNTADYQAGNYFRTKEKAEQAAAIVKDALQKVHEKDDER